VFVYRRVGGRRFIACRPSKFASFCLKTDVPISSVAVSQMPEIRYVIAEIDEIEFYDTVSVYLVEVRKLMLEQCE
jgi:hypothetical protein